MIKHVTEIFKTVCLSASLTRFFWLTSLLLAASPLCAQQIKLSSNTEISTEGYFVLSWQPETAIADNGASAKHDAVFLRQSQSRDFSVSKKYAIASIEALTLSGFEDGEYFFQIVSPAGNSNVLQVRVQHHA